MPKTTYFLTADSLSEMVSVVSLRNRLEWREGRGGKVGFDPPIYGTVDHLENAMGQSHKVDTEQRRSAKHRHGSWIRRAAEEERPLSLHSLSLRASYDWLC